MDAVVVVAVVASTTPTVQGKLSSQSSSFPVSPEIKKRKMSWKTAGHLLSGPPSSSLPSSSDIPVVKRLKPNLYGKTAHQRESNFISHYGYDEDSISLEEKNRKSDWDVVKENHRFIREDEDPNDRNVTWEERVARSYEAKLFKEFALIDLKHYKSHTFALRWRTAPEVIDGIGENTCGSLRCKYHKPPSPSTSRHQIKISDLRFKDPDTASTNISTMKNEEDKGISVKEFEDEMDNLKSFELPFVYLEDGERKEALVKARLCRGCQGKLRWKSKDERRGKDKEQEEKERERSGRKDGYRNKERTEYEGKGKGKDRAGHRSRDENTDRDRDRDRDRHPRGDSDTRKNKHHGNGKIKDRESEERRRHRHKRDNSSSQSNDSDEEYHKSRKYREEDKGKERKHKRPDSRSKSRSPPRHNESSQRHR